MKRILPFLFILIITACSSEEQVKTKIPAKTIVQEQSNHAPKHSPFQSLTPTEAIELIGNKSNLLILDTRTTKEIIRYGAIKDAVQADIRTIAQNGLPNPKDQPILVVCAVGGRSYAVGKFLVKKGHTEIYNLNGGIDRWTQEGFPVVYPK